MSGPDQRKKIPMKMYHGTTAARLPSILANGLTARTADKDSNWQTCPSKEGFVYFTKAYPLYFAQSAAKGDQNLLIVEVETEWLSPFRLCPDEDFIAQAIMMNRKSGGATGVPELDTAQSLRELTALIDPMEYQEEFQKSVEYLGQSAYYGDIEPECITRYAVIKSKPALPIIVEGLEPTITIENYRICGAYYEDLTAFVMGDRAEAPDGRTFYYMRNEHSREEIEAQIYGSPITEQGERWKKAAEHKKAQMIEARTKGIKVTTLNATQ